MNVTPIPLLLFVTNVKHEADNAYSIWSTWLCYWQVGFPKVAYSGKQYILDLSLINSLLSPFIWMCHFDSIVPLDLELNNQVFDQL